MKAYALLGEIEEDGRILSPEEELTRLRDGLEALNRDHARSLPVPLTLSGEVPEFAGLLTDLIPVYPLARTLAEAFHPLAVRVAVTAGEVALPVDPAEADGPAFDAAAELLYRVRKEDRLLLYRSGSGERDVLANAMVLLLYHDFRRWTERQVQVVRLFRRYGRQQPVAESLGISQQAVSGALSAVGWRALSEAEATLESVFSARAGGEP
jgi:hypothetical protein